MRVRLGVDVGGTKLNAGLLDESGKVLCKRSARICEPPAADAVMRLAAQTAQALLAELGLCTHDVLCCGMGIPGTVSSDGRVAGRVPNLGWTNARCAEAFEALTGIPCTLVQDSRAAAWGEYKAGAGQNHRLVVCVTLGTGIGTGIVLNGRLYHGALGTAGELGHTPVAEDGRACGCGRRGCLECYAAGKGLAQTASEELCEPGGSMTAEALFEAAERGDGRARRILEDAVVLLGRTLTSMVDLLSPDALLFSGGMSARRELFVEPLLAYIRSHAYAPALEGLLLGYAALGSDAPMVGAALYPEPICRPDPRISVSVMCADALDLGSGLRELEAAGVDYLHCDVMDGHFVPNLMLAPETIASIRAASKLPLDIHLMAEEPERLIPRLGLRPGDIASAHYESTPHVQRALALIRDSGASAALALNPSTPIECCRDVLDDVAMVLVMTVNPGYAGQKLVPQTLTKIARLRAWLDGLGYTHVRIQADGNCSFENAEKMAAAGADTFVAGSSSVFDPAYGIMEGVRLLRKAVDRGVTHIKEEAQ